MKKYAIIALAPLAILYAAALVNGAYEENKIPDHLQTILENAEQFDLLSLDPKDSKEKPKNNFHGWRVLGKTTVRDAETRKKLLAAFKKGVAENKGEVARCFNPRHGIRVTHDGKILDFVICFECYQVHAFAGDKQDKSFLVTDSPQATFDNVLKEANVPMAEKPKK